RYPPLAIRHSPFAIRYSPFAARCRFRLGSILALPIHSVPRPTPLVPLQVGKFFVINYGLKPAA
ncbi:hypothetical protein, partial [Fervidibacter sp.]